MTLAEMLDLIDNEIEESNLTTDKIKVVVSSNFGDMNTISVYYQDGELVIDAEQDVN